MSTPANVTPFDPRPLVEPIDVKTARAFARQLRASGQVPGMFGSNVVVLAIAVVVFVVFLFGFGTVAVSVMGSFIAMGMQSGNPSWSLFSLLPLAVIVVAVVFVVLGVVRNFGGSAERWYRLDRFARANSMQFFPALENPPLPGMIFSLGHARLATDLVRGEHPRFVEFANYRYKTGSGKDESTHNWGYVAVKLATPLPNIVLDAKSNNALFGSNLPASFDKAQRLSLEGDFDKHFALYCPQGYERDALYLFTPDIMARFIDHAAALDVEIVDDWLFLYAQRDFSTLDPATWAWLFSVVGALLDKFAQWARWRDDRLAQQAAAPPVATAHVAAGTDAASAATPTALPFAAPQGALTPPPPGVAAQGRRLRQRVPVAAFVVFGVFVVIFLLMQFGAFAGFVSSIP